MGDDNQGAPFYGKLTETEYELLSFVDDSWVYVIQNFDDISYEYLEKSDLSKVEDLLNLTQIAKQNLGETAYNDTLHYGGIFLGTGCYFDRSKIDSSIICSPLLAEWGAVPEQDFPDDIPENGYSAGDYWYSPGGNLGIYGENDSVVIEKVTKVCNPPLIYIEEQGNKLGVGGVYKKMGYVSHPEVYYDKIVDFQGNKKSQENPDDNTGVLQQQGMLGQPTFWTWSVASWGYTDYVVGNPKYEYGYHDTKSNFDFYDSIDPLNETICLYQATHVSFIGDDHAEKIPLTVTMLNDESEICSIIQNLISQDAEPTAVKYADHYIMQETSTGSRNYINQTYVSDDSDKYIESGIYFDDELNRWIFYSDTTPRPWEGIASIGYLAWSEQTDCPIYPWDVAWPVIPGSTFFQNLYTLIYDEGNNSSGGPCVQHFPYEHPPLCCGVTQEFPGVYFELGTDGDTLDDGVDYLSIMLDYEVYVENGGFVAQYDNPGLPTNNNGLRVQKFLTNSTGDVNWCDDISLVNLWKVDDGPGLGGNGDLNTEIEFTEENNIVTMKWKNDNDDYETLFTYDKNTNCD